MKSLKIFMQTNPLSAYIIRFISNNPIYKNVLLIGSSVVLAQLISVVTLPIITRLYSPADLGVLGVYSSTLFIVVVFASLKYEFAYTLPKKDETAANLFALCLLLLTVTSIAFSIVLLLAKGLIINNFHLESLDLYLWLLIPGFIGMGLYTILNYWAIRQRDYQRIAATKINQSASGAVCKIVLGLFSFGSTGLIIGHIISQVAGIGTFLRAMWKTDRDNRKKISFSGIKSVAKEYKKFPLFTLPQQLVNTLSLQLPVFMLLSIYGVQVVGFYTLAQSLLVLPVNFISSSLSQVFTGEVSKLVREDCLEMKSFYIKTLTHLCLVGIPLIGGVALIAPIITPLIFGASWTDAGWYCLPLALMVIPQFIVAPISRLNIYGYNHWSLIWDVIRVCAIFTGFYYCRIFEFSVMATLTIYAIIMLSLYVVLIFLDLKAISNYTSSIDRQNDL
jgi:O-antigen/teichoic acid export membrane protein